MSRKTQSGSSADSIDTQLSLTDVDRVRGREDVDVTTETETHEEFDHCCADIAGQTETFETAETIEGLVLVGVEHEGKVLLVDGPHDAWTLPGGLITDSEEWLGGAQSGAVDQTGLDVRIEKPVRVTRVENHLEESEKQTTTYDIVLSASLGQTPAENDRSQYPEVRGDGDWFASPPEPIDEGDRDAVEQFFD